MVLEPWNLSLPFGAPQGYTLKQAKQVPLEDGLGTSAWFLNWSIQRVQDRQAMGLPTHGR